MSKVLEEMVSGGELYDWIREVLENNTQDEAVGIIGISWITVNAKSKSEAIEQAYKKAIETLYTTKEEA